MTILVFGQTGQVARELAHLPDTHCVGREMADLSVPDACKDLISLHKPTAVINAAAYTLVDKAEDNAALAMCVNGDAPGEMATACAALDIPLVHISTDYVFDGTGDRPWQVEDKTNPINTYGRSKLCGEDNVRASGATHAILRTSWVFSAYGNNFVKTIKRLAGERDHLSIVSDQIGGPTSARDIAEACHRIAHELVSNPEKSGTYHFSGTPDVSWADFARAIVEHSGLSTDISDIPTSDYPTPAKRPLNSRLDCSATTSQFGIERPDWESSLKHVLKDLE